MNPVFAFLEQTTAILHQLGIDSICMWMSVDNEEISLAVCNLLQAITDSLSGEGKEEQHGKEEALVLGNHKLSFWVFDGYNMNRSSSFPWIK